MAVDTWIPAVARRFRRRCLILATAAALTGSAANAQTGEKRPVNFSARDSLVISMSAAQTGTLYGKSAASFGEAELTAWRIRIDFDANQLYATRPDSALSSREGVPTFTRGSESFSGDEFAYNLDTERGRVVGARSAIEEGFIRAAAVRTEEDSTVFVYKGIYSTCECIDDPSYSLRANRMKIVDQKWVYTGPIRLYLFNIPTPLWLPFGFLPAQEGRRSGPLPPIYGEDEFGFYLRDFGWYFALNGYTDLQLQVGLWTRGSWQTAAQFRYNRRYRYSGSAYVEYARLRRGVSGDPDFSVNRTAAIRWDHAQTLSPYASFDASVDLTESGYLQAISDSYDDRVRQTIGSSVSYRKRWAGPGRSLTAKFSQQQQLAAGSANLTLPSVSFSQTSRKPLKRTTVAPGQTERWFERLTYSYGAILSNAYSFQPLNESQLEASGDSAATGISWYDALFSKDKYRRATGDLRRFAFRTSHSVPITASFTLNRLPPFGGVQLSLSPSFRYTEDWFLQTDRRTIDDENRVQVSNVDGFFSARQFNTGVSASTTVYGLFPFRAGSYQGIRHTFRPSLSFNHQPDFFAERWGYTRVYTDTSGTEVRYAIAPGIRRGKQQSLSLSLSNTFETKEIGSDSSAADRTLKVLNLDVQGSYNFAADSLKMSSIAVAARTRLLGRVDVNANASFSPYGTSATGTLVDNYVFDLSRFRFARLTLFRATARTSLRSRSRGAARPLENARSTNPSMGRGIDPLTGQPDVNYRGIDAVYSDFSIPWSLTLDLTYSYSKRGIESVRSAIVNASVDLNLTPNWKVAARSGYDFQARDVVTTNLALYRDFECWQLSVNWIPFGAYQSWGFDLHVKSGHLRDFLRIRQPRSDVEGRFGRL